MRRCRVASSSSRFPPCLLVKHYRRPKAMPGVPGSSIRRIFRATWVQPALQLCRKKGANSDILMPKQLCLRWVRQTPFPVSAFPANVFRWPLCRSARQAASLGWSRIHRIPRPRSPTIRYLIAVPRPRGARNICRSTRQLRCRGPRNGALRPRPGRPKGLPKRRSLQGVSSLSPFLAARVPSLPTLGSVGSRSMFGRARSGDIL